MMTMMVLTCTRSLADDTNAGCPPSSQITDSLYSSPCSRSNVAAVSSWYSPSPTVINRKLFSARLLSPLSVQSKRPLRPSSRSETTTCATKVPAASDSGTLATSALPDAYSRSLTVLSSLGGSDSVGVILYVCLSVTFVYCVETSKHVLNFFSPSGRSIILILPHQMFMATIRRGPPNEASNAGGM